jgi:exopolysaccharide production protein ExoZ
MFKSLQAGRVVAAILITLHHLGGAFAADKYFGAKTLGQIFSFGHYSVVFFFVLSGFLIVWIHASDVGKPLRLGYFARKRFTRIFPAYWIVFIAVYTLARFVPALSSTVPHDIATVVRSLLLIPQDPLVVGGTGAPVLVVAWSLQYEMMFYAVVACFIASRWLGGAIVALLLSGVLACRLGSRCEFPVSILGGDYVLPFLFGAMTALLVRSRLAIAEPLRLAALAVAIICSLRGFEVVFDVSLLKAPSGAVVYGSLSAVLLLALVRAEQAGRIRLSANWNQLADSSYALFLLHFPMISILCKFAVLLGVNSAFEIGIAFVTIFLICLLTAFLFHRWIERPLLRWLSASKARRQQPDLIVATPEIQSSQLSARTSGVT